MSSLKSLGVCVLVAATACAGRTPPAGASEETSSRAQASTRRQRDVITKEELADPAIRAQSVLEVVKLLRPHFLTDRGGHSIVDPGAGKVHVSIDNGKIVPLEELRGIHANGVIEIRYLNAAAAMQKFGGAALEGPVILVRTM